MENIARNELNKHVKTKILNYSDSCYPTLMTSWWTYNFQVLVTPQERVWKEQSKFLKSKLWILHQNNAPVHTALSAERYLATKGTLQLVHVLHSSALWFFPVSGDQVCVTRIGVDGWGGMKIGGDPKCSSKEDFKHCFNRWKKRNQQCVARGADRFEKVHSIVE